MKFSRNFLGYRRAEVDAAIERLERSAVECAREVDTLKAEISRLEEAVEGDKLTIASLRRMVDALTRQQGDAAVPVTIMIGPVNSVSAVVNLVEGIENLDTFTVRFQVFRDGFYRFDGYTNHTGSIIEWLQEHEDVSTVHHDKETIFVALKGAKI